MALIKSLRHLRSFSVLPKNSIQQIELPRLKDESPTTIVKLKRVYKDIMDLTKFKLSLLNSVGAYSMFYFYAPLSGVGLFNSAMFLFATQSVAMSS